MHNMQNTKKQSNKGIYTTTPKTQNEALNIKERNLHKTQREPVQGRDTSPLVNPQTLIEFQIF